jgi:hypothetical protein
MPVEPGRAEKMELMPESTGSLFFSALSTPAESTLGAALIEFAILLYSLD